MKPPLKFVSSLALAALVTGCATGAAAKARKLSPAVRAAIYARAEQFFTNAILLKPRDGGAETNLAFALAPLLLQEVGGANSVAVPTAVYFETGRTSLHGKTHAQVTYLWDVGVAPVRRKTTPGKQGIRLTLDARGLPVIWEVLNDPSGAQIIFVAQSLEAGAAKSYGAVLPGRRFAVEPDLAAAPDSIVARVIEDGPAVMGPLVHLGAAGEVTTLICRCMTAQTRAVQRTGYYELRPLPKGRQIAPAKLDSALRLPPDF